MGFLSFYRVYGSSMEPYVRAGDYVFVRRFFPWEKPRENDVIIAPDPRDATRLLMKRIAQIYEGGYTVLGDNREESTDSRTFGRVSRQIIQGKVIARVRR